MKRGFIAAAIVIGTLAAAECAQTAGIGLRLNGGACYVMYPDYNDFVDDVNAQLMLESSVTGELGALHWGMEFGGELFMGVMPAVDVAVGAGFMSGASEFSFAAGDESMSFEHRAKSYPLTATVYAKLPIPLGVVKPFVFGGGGAYPTTITFEESVDSGAGSSSYEAELSKTGFGVHGGVGCAIGIMPMASIEISVRGRYAKITGFEGTATSSDGETADVFLAKELGDDGFHHFGPEAVEDKALYEEASVDLSGFSFMLGLAFSF